MIELKGSLVRDIFPKLKLQLKGILPLFDRRSRIVYLDYPVSKNVGDLLINLGTEQFFVDHDIPISERYSVLDVPTLTHIRADKNTTFLCNGGGNFGDLYPKHQKLREAALGVYPESRFVFLPQSLHYTSRNAQGASLKRIASHRNCHILVRDRESFDALKMSGVSQCTLMPDMVHQLWDSLAATMESEKGAYMCFLRKDCEATAVPDELSVAFSRESVDWEDIVSVRHRVMALGLYYMLKVSGRGVSSWSNSSKCYAVRDIMIRDAVTFFSRYERIYTNRLHAMLLALLLGRDVIAFDNSYGKLSRYAQAFLSECLVK